MPRELITVQVGQCGNQIGYRFWELALREHSAHSPSFTFDDSMSTFFRNESRSGSVCSVGSEVDRLRARAVLVDMEEGVVNRVSNGPLGGLFDSTEFITDVSGAGNNWAYGYSVCGPQYGAAVMEQVRRQAERCDSLQSFFLLHSIGGGTGSGLGTYILGQLADNFPLVCRFATSVFPSEDDDVITSPYNAILSASELIQHADCVMPVENQALLDIVERIDAATRAGQKGVRRGGAGVHGALLAGTSIAEVARSWRLGSGRAGIGGAGVGTSSRRAASSESTALAAPMSSSASSSAASSSSAAAVAGSGARAARRQRGLGPRSAASDGRVKQRRGGASGGGRGRGRGRARVGERRGRADDAAAPAPPRSSSGSRDRSGTARTRLEGAALPRDRAVAHDGGSAYDGMNTVAANLLTNLTASMRFDGTLNVDLNEITTNLVPFPRVNFVMSAIAPLGIPADVRMRSGSRRIERAIDACFDRRNQLIRADPLRSTYLATALLLRGNVTVSDVGRNIDRVKAGNMQMAVRSCAAAAVTYCLLCTLRYKRAVDAHSLTISFATSSSSVVEHGRY